MDSAGNPVKTFAVTTPLYYVNALPHIGSAYTTIAADALARFHRLLGQPVLMITGTDEHGQKIQRTAEARGLEPQAHCDEIVAGFYTLWERLNIAYDRFSRTTAPRHAAIVQEFYQRVWQSGDIYEGRQQGWYCVACEEFKEERELLPGKRCPIHTNKPVEWRDEHNYFFKLSNYQEKLSARYAEQPEFIQPVTRRNEVLNFVDSGLQDFSISRINLDWGFPVPTAPEQTLYVWFDALLGYVTALLDDADEPTLENALRQWWPINIHLIGKDILRFHAVYWPAMLMSAGLPLPDRVFGHGFLTKDGQKMGKSLGNTLDPLALVNQYGADAVRFYFLKEIEFGRDGDFSETRFVNVLNADLANDLGNLLNRTLKMASRYCGGKIPKISMNAFTDHHPLAERGANLAEQVQQAYENLAFSEACEAVLSLVRASNKYLDETAPWTLFKQGQQTETEIVLYAVLESVRLSGYLLAPIVPELATAIYTQLGFAADFDQRDIGQQLPFKQHSVWGTLPGEQRLGKASPIFQRIEIPAEVS